MGHRSYLYLNKSSEAFIAFEANNSLPFFWLTLIDSKSLADKIKEWKAFEIASTGNEIDNDLLHFQIDLEKFQRNASTGMHFITSHFPKAVSLYKDFIKALENTFEQEDKLLIEIDQFSAFYESLDAYLQDLTEEINAIEQNKPTHIRFLYDEDLIASGTGFASASLKRFSALPSYQQALQHKRKIATIQNKYLFKKQSLALFIVILLVCPVFTWAIFRGFKEEGFSATVLLLGIANIGFYLYSVWEIITQIKAYKAEKSDR